jgi:hypothetical protein
LSPDRRYRVSPAALGESYASPLTDIVRKYQITSDPYQITYRHLENVNGNGSPPKRAEEGVDAH